MMASEAVPPAQTLRIVFIPDLVRKLAQGWSEDQLVSGCGNVIKKF